MSNYLHKLDGWLTDWPPIPCFRCQMGHLRRFRLRRFQLRPSLMQKV